MAGDRARGNCRRAKTLVFGRLLEFSKWRVRALPPRDDAPRLMTILALLALLSFTKISRVGAETLEIKLGTPQTVQLA